MKKLFHWFTEKYKRTMHAVLPSVMEAQNIGPTLEDIADRTQRIDSKLLDHYLSSQLKNVQLNVSVDTLGDFFDALDRAAISMEPATEKAIYGNRDTRIKFANPNWRNFYDFLCFSDGTPLEPMEAWNLLKEKMNDAVAILDTFRSSDDELNHRFYVLIAYGPFWRECFLVIDAFAELAGVKLPAAHYAPAKLYSVWFPKKAT